VLPREMVFGVGGDVVDVPIPTSRVNRRRIIGGGWRRTGGDGIWGLPLGVGSASLGLRRAGDDAVCKLGGLVGVR
jgi:hypothetical protein